LWPWPGRRSDMNPLDCWLRSRSRRR
jgi:hypothetical protein